MRNFCIFVVALTFLVALLCLAEDNGGGFLPHFGRILAGMALLAGNLISAPLNFIYYHKHRQGRWLFCALCIQVPVAVMTVLWLISLCFG